MLCQKPHYVWGIKYSKSKKQKGMKLQNAFLWPIKENNKKFFPVRSANDLMP